MQRVIGMDIHRTFAEVVFWEAGRLRPAGRIDMTRSGLEGFGRSLSKEDEVVVEATGNAMAVVRPDLCLRGSHKLANFSWWYWYAVNSDAKRFQRVLDGAGNCRRRPHATALTATFDPIFCIW